MYEQKQFYMWLMVIPFWIIHVFGGGSAFTKCDFFNPDNEVYISDSYVSHDPVETTFEDLFKNEKKEYKEIKLCCSEPYTKISLKKSIKRLKNSQVSISGNILLCDSAIDKIDKQYFSYMCALDESLEDNSLINII